MKKKLTAALCCSVVLSAMLTGCGAANYADGTYEGKSRVYEGDEEGNGDGYGVVTLTIKDNEITACEFRTYQTDGTLKDENYGKQEGEVANKDYFAKAQKAVRACPVYAENLIGHTLGEVDVISGATISYDEFKEAVNDALSQARE